MATSVADRKPARDIASNECAALTVVREFREPVRTVAKTNAVTKEVN